MTNEKMVSVKLSAEAFGFVGNMTKKEFETMLATAIKCDLVLTTCKGEKFKLEILEEIQADHISLYDEDGIEIEDADQLSC